jgi:dTDP-4-dehydrorhamnose reductase
MRIAVLGAGGGLGRNVVDAARAAKHDVVALVRDPKRAALPDDVTTVVGNAIRVDDVVRAMTGADATMFCVNPPFASWLTTFRPLLACAIAAARQTNSRLVFPANVWIYGAGCVNELIAESRVPSPTSRRGKLRAEMEQRIHAAGIRYAMIRLPEFYGPSVVSLTARVFRAALADRRALWPGPLDVTIELVYMPDAARVLSRSRSPQIATPPCFISQACVRRRGSSPISSTRRRAASRASSVCRTGCCPLRACLTRRHVARPTSGICGHIRFCSTARRTPRASARSAGRRSPTRSRRRWRGIARTQRSNCKPDSSRW